MPRRARILVSTILLAAVAAAGGCYKHVVSTGGIGNDDVDTYEANVPDNKGPLESMGWEDGKEVDKSWRDR